ncbi:MAG: D-glycero-beta-D-manno-heptose 1-phosphate adenylyltransferase [Thermodesulfobacteria bacterium]|nr:D-glycero-beta-D-manno-heptose 1-phosphate adenylyltransferase [Thermodesulfobacteriota bacterium]
MLKLELFQLKTHEIIYKNAEKILKFIQNSDAELLVLPELALTGYKLEPLPSSCQITQEFIDEHLKEFQKALKPEQILVIGAPLFKEKEIYNSAYLVSKENIEVIAEKYLLFPGVDDQFTPGITRKIFKFKNFKIGVILCFELRAPEIFREFFKQGVNLVLVIAQWPVSRISHWDALLSARAIENRFFVAGVNALGFSKIVSPEGDTIKCAKDEECTLYAQISSEVPQLPYPIRSPFLKLYPNKVKTLEELKRIIENRRKKGQTFVFTNGCFDILHAGHVDYLQKARKLGDFLVVGLNSDSSVKKIKGKHRPVNPEVFRAQVLSALECVDYIVIFEEETPEKLIKELRPDILVKGADWEEDKIVGADFVKSYGGKVERIRFTYQISTTAIIEKILSNLVK